MAIRKTFAPPSGGFGMTITTTPDFPPDLSDIAHRLKKNIPIWNRLKDELTIKAQNFTDRFQRVRMPIRGERKQPPAGSYGVGYQGRLKIRPADKKVSITSSRPFVPRLTDHAIDAVIITALEGFWMDDTGASESLIVQHYGE